MSGLQWQRSSFSGSGGTGECVEVVTLPPYIQLRESDCPATVLTVTPPAWRALLNRAMDGALDRP